MTQPTRIRKAEMSSTPYVWSLSDETHYLLHLGTGKWSGAAMTRRRLLESYIETLWLRDDKPTWMGKAYAYAKERLRAEFGG